MLTRLYAALPRAALPRHDAASPRAASPGARKAAASPRGPRQAGGSQGRGFAARPRLRRVAAASPRDRGFAATHGPWHVPTTINIEMVACLSYVDR